MAISAKRLWQLRELMAADSAYELGPLDKALVWEALSLLIDLQREQQRRRMHAGEITRASWDKLNHLTP